jgi:hypothetical protein
VSETLSSIKKLGLECSRGDTKTSVGVQLKTGLYCLGVKQTEYENLQQTSGKKKQGHCVQGDYKHFENQTHFPNRSMLFRSILYKG